jgi:hypothetical protein
MSCEEIIIQGFGSHANSLQIFLCLNHQIPQFNSQVLHLMKECYSDLMGERTSTQTLNKSQIPGFGHLQTWVL